MSGTTYYQRNKEVMLNRANEYYQNNKEGLREKAKNKYRELSEAEINIKENMEEICIIIYLKKRNKN